MLLTCVVCKFDYFDMQMSITQIALRITAYVLVEMGKYSLQCGSRRIFVNILNRSVTYYYFTTSQKTKQKGFMACGTSLEM